MKPSVSQMNIFNLPFHLISLPQRGHPTFTKIQPSFSIGFSGGWEKS